MSEEIRQHLAALTERNLAQGMSPDEARQAAERLFGHVEGVKEQCRDLRGLPWLESLLRDFRYGVRLLRGQPGFAAAAIVTLALGLGTSTTIFSIVHAVILRPLPYPDPGRLISIYESLPPKYPQLPVSPRMFLEWQKEHASLQASAVTEHIPVVVTGEGEASRAIGLIVSEAYFKVLGVPPQLGRTFPSADRDDPVVLSHRLWLDRFQGRRDVIGRKISIVKSGRHDAAFYAKMWKVILSTGTWRGEVWDRRKNGEIYPKWLTITAVKGADGVVSHYVSTHADITERKMSEDQIKKLAFYDPLTELPNRRLLQERIKHSISMERRDGRQMALLMLDLDRFKAVNDNLGHLAGDELLQQVAGRISARLREVDMVARLGGDEFIILLEDIVQPEDAALVAKEIIADLSKPFKLSQCDDVHIGGSIGISLHPQHGDNADTLMDHADAALYQAKGAGRGCFAYFSKDQTIAARERIALESRLRHALEQQQLLVFFQPQIDIASGCIIGAEALVRWQDPVDGLVMPSRFIPIAEETGLIVEIGAWVLQETCRQGREWLDAGLPAITLAVNVSPHQFQRGDICALVAKVLKQTGFPPGQLELEITETGLMDNQAIAVDILNDLRAQGVRFAIDDFGTGYSSLSYLKLFPLNVLKIDKSFIDDIPSSQGDMEIAATIIAMGHILGFKVLAEGVETAKQLAFLQEKGCNSYQGFINSQPIPVAEFDQLLRRQQRGD